MSSIQIDDSRWPIVHVIQHQAPSEADYAEMLRRLDRYYSREVPLATVMDLHYGGLASPVLVQLQGQWLRDRRKRLARLCLGAGAGGASSPWTAAARVERHPSMLSTVAPLMAAARPSAARAMIAAARDEISTARYHAQRDTPRKAAGCRAGS